MTFDEEKLRVAMNKEDFGELSVMYHEIQDMYPLKLKILKNVVCKRCGFCCKSCNAMLSKQDIELLCKYLQCDYEEFYEKYMDKNTRAPYLKLPCPFLGEDNECDVYPARPKVCREFPFNEYTVVVDPCPLGNDIRSLVEEIEGPVTEINDDAQKAANISDEIFGHMVNMENVEDTGRHLRMNVNMYILKKVIGLLKHKRKKERKLRR